MCKHSKDFAYSACACVGICHYLLTILMLALGALTILRMNRVEENIGQYYYDFSDCEYEWAKMGYFNGRLAEETV